MTNKEKFYIIAIQNLIKQNKFLELYQQRDTDQISDDEFYRELEDNQDVYCVKIDQECSIENLKTVASIIEEIGGEFNTCEVESMFSISHLEMTKYI